MNINQVSKDMQDKLQKLQSKIAQAKLGGGEKRIAKQHAKGKLTARERIELLMDEGSFEEIGMLVTHRSKDFGMENQKFFGRWSCDGIRHHQWAIGVCFLPRFHRFWGFAFRNPCRENMQNHGLSHAERRTFDWHERFGRRTDSRRGQFSGCNMPIYF